MGHKEKYCYYKKSNIHHHPLLPINCRKYDGIVLTDSQLKEYYKLARESERVS